MLPHRAAGIVLPHRVAGTRYIISLSLQLLSSAQVQSQFGRKMEKLVCCTG